METMEDRGAGPKWHRDNIKMDLVEQGGLRDEEVIIDLFSVHTHGCRGSHKGMPFNITWVKDTFLLVSMIEFDQELIDAFAKVVEYQPFCRYISKKSSLPTVEWDVKDPEGRYAELQKTGEPQLQQI